MKNMKKQINKGFTLIELLIVIAIIGILIAIATFGSQNAFQATRDVTRKSDLKQYQSALESFANKNNGLFPSAGGGDKSVNIATDVCPTLGLANCPTDPTTGHVYSYNTDGTGGTTATKYTIAAGLETKPSSTVTLTWWVCSNGKSGTTAINSQMGLPTPVYSDGYCPI